MFQIGSSLFEKKGRENDLERDSTVKFGIFNLRRETAKEKIPRLKERVGEGLVCESMGSRHSGLLSAERAGSKDKSTNKGSERNQ